MDAPRHLLSGAAGVDSVDLDACMGPARVVDVGEVGSIGSELLSSLLSPVACVERLLLKSRCSSGDPQARHPTFPALEPAAAEALLRAGLVLLGVDAPSVDPADSQELPVHRTLLEAGVVLLENLWLAGVPPGDYELVALPLKLVGCDGSPVRAVLRTLPSR